MEGTAGGHDPTRMVVGSPVDFQFTFQTPSLLLEFHQPSHMSTTPSSLLSRSAEASQLTRLAFKPWQYSNLVLRSLAFFFAFASAVSLSRVEEEYSKHNFHRFSEFRYSIGVAIVAVISSALQLVKGIREMAFNGACLSDKASDYTTFVLDQMVTYLLLSSSSVCALSTGRMEKSKPETTAMVTSVCTSFAAFAAVAVSTLISGCRLCKRIMW